ncbi:putative G-protein coupled receptor 141 G-protein coupled receptor PGR13 [Channa argus]|uniref:Putative G-protein coupled receptor 141 G-protein coupled receptor PGR13 n=1 Tax=Channa argus TaxID=215402 RepID=A0A6G1QLY1_CHAAH|nr:putative G-protein coupled receptor 141 G-protein coupled receptor PGR13 [Channa argus]
MSSIEDGTTPYTIQSTTTPSNNSTKVSYGTVLLSVYSVVLLTGTISLSLMIHILKSNSTSITSIAVLNLIFAHFLFLFTVPFRIYYYASGDWNLGFWWCKVVSAMIHIHMYMSFVFYVIILITRLLTFYHKSEVINSFQRHTVVLSIVVWIVVFISVCSIQTFYGVDQNNQMNEKICFNFGRNIDSNSTVFNYIVSTVIIVGATILTALQANVLRVLYKKYDQGCTSQQEFSAQLKSLFFALIMVVCFIPYHVFRLYYLQHINELESFNEMFLSLTTFNCLDMLTFLGRRTCYGCFPGKTA